MTVRVSHLLYAALALAVVAYLVSTLSGEERRIKRRLEAIRALIEKDGAESGLEAANRARRLGELFADPFEIRLTPYGVTVQDRQQLLRTVAGYRAGVERIAVTFHRQSLEIDARTGRAEHAFEATVNASGGDGPSRERYRFHARWLRTGDEWTIRDLELLEVLAGPARLF